MKEVLDFTMFFIGIVLTILIGLLMFLNYMETATKTNTLLYENKIYELKLVKEKTWVNK